MRKWVMWGGLGHRH